MMWWQWLWALGLVVWAILLIRTQIFLMRFNRQCKARMPPATSPSQKEFKAVCREPEWIRYYDSFKKRPTSCAKNKEIIGVFSDGREVTGVVARESAGLLSFDEIGNFSDGYHTFNELYEHRHALFIALCRLWGGYSGDSWRAKLHADGTMFEGWFIMGLERPKGEQITYHLPERGRCDQISRELLVCVCRLNRPWHDGRGASRYGRIPGRLVLS